MNKNLSIIVISLFFTTMISASTDIYAGQVNGNWNVSGSPYLIHGNIEISADQDLTINPGVEVIFQGHFRFKVYGKLLAIGTVNDSIIFTAQNVDEGWFGLRFIDTETNGQNASILTYCLFEYGNALTGNEENNRGGALSCLYSSDVQLLGCQFSNNKADYGGAIELRYSDIIIQDCIICYNYASHDAGGIIVNDESEAIINNSVISYNNCVFNGGGIYCCNNASPTLNNVIIQNNSTTCDDGISEPGGGGLSCKGGEMELNNVSICDNSSTGFGGGIECGNSTISFTIGSVCNNEARLGGGISNFGTIYLAEVTISYNISEHAGGIYQIGELNFDAANRCNIYLNNATDESNYGNDMICYSNENVIVDTFTVMDPTEFHTYPIDNFTFDILQPKIYIVTSDLYVSPSGSDENSGLTPSEPLQTIFQALQMISPDSLNHLTIHLAEGMYSSSTTNEIFPIQMIDYLTLDGAGRSSTILDAEGAEQVVEFSHIESGNLSNLTVTDAIHQGIFCSNSQINIENVYSFNNDIGINLYECPDIDITNTIIAYNNDKGVYCNGTNLFLSSTSIFKNSGTYIGGGIDIVYSSVEFDSENRCNIYLNSADFIGQDFAIYNTTVYAVLDTFTVMEPCQYFVNNMDDFTYDILNAAVETTDSNLYVSPSGSDENSGLTPGDPLKTITYAYLKVIGNAQNPQTIFLAEGTYSSSQTGETFPLKCRSYVTLSGANQSTSILDAEHNNRLISCYYSNACIENLTVTHSNSSSIYMGQYQNIVENVELNNLIIKDNYSSGSGAGINCHDCDPVFNNLIIQNNTSGYNGGGIYLDDADPTMNNVTIKYNFAERKGGGLYCDSSSPSFSNDSRSNIFLNETEDGFSRDLYNWGAVVDVIVDTFTVEYPDNYYAQPVNNFTFDILHSVVQQIDQDVFVSPYGSDSNSGLTPNDPFKTISFALSMIISNSSDPNTVHLAAGVYSPSGTGEIFPIYSKDHIIIQGVDSETTILDAQDQSRVFCCESNDFILEKVTLCNGNAFAGNEENTDGGGLYMIYGNNIGIYDVIIRDNQASDGGGIYNSAHEVEISNVIIENNTANDGGGYFSFFGQSVMVDTMIRSNSANYGGGVYSDAFSEINLMNVVICNNHADNGTGGGLFLVGGNDSDVIVVCSTICNNSADESGGGIYISTSEIVLLNSICWNNLPEEIVLDNWNSTDIEIDFSDIEGGENSIINNGYGQIIWGDGNIVSDPFFIDPDEGNYFLHYDSPCIDSGTAFYEWDGDVILDLSPDEYYGSAPDMGGLEWTGTYTQNDIIPNNLNLRNYPNPFNPSTTISFSLNTEITENTELIIYNLKGQKVKTISVTLSGVEESQAINTLHPSTTLRMTQVGNREYSVTWNGKDDNNKPVASGVYFYRLKSDQIDKTKKMLLLK